jgi:hypothetical protein
MTREGPGGGVSDGVGELVESLRDVPALVVDRYLTVVAANPMARTLSGAFRPTVNIARYAFLDPVVEDDSSDWVEATGQIAAMLRDSLEQHGEDDEFRALIGELSSRSRSFAQTWAHDRRRPARSAQVRFVQPFIGPIVLTFQELWIPDEFDLVLLLWRPTVSVESRRAFARLAALAAE